MDLNEPVKEPVAASPIAEMYDRRVAEAERRGLMAPCAMEVRGTSYAEGQTRWRFGVADIRRMVEAGILAEDDRVELWGGELVVMPAKNIRHEHMKNRLVRHLARAVGDDLMVAIESGLDLGDHSFLVPDIMLFEDAIGHEGLTPANVLLVMEILDSSIRKDLGAKANLYAAHGVRELWVVEANSLVTRIHREPGPTGYRHVYERREGDPLISSLVPDLSLTLADIV